MPTSRVSQNGEENRRPALRVSVGKVGLGLRGSKVVQRQEVMDHHVNWRVRELTPGNWELFKYQVQLDGVSAQTSKAESVASCVWK